MKHTHLLVGLIIAAFIGPAAAQRQKHDSDVLVVENAWARATPPMAQTGAVYFTIRNSGHTADRLVAASSPAAKAAEIHTHLHEGNVMRMRKVDGVDVKPGATVSFAPGGYHVMLTGLKAPLNQNEQLAVSLTFEKAGKIDVTVSVQGPGAMHHGDAGGGSDTHRHQH